MTLSIAPMKKISLAVAKLDMRQALDYRVQGEIELLVILKGKKK